MIELLILAALVLLVFWLVLRPDRLPYSKVLIRDAPEPVCTEDKHFKRIAFGDIRYVARGGIVWYSEEHMLRCTIEENRWLTRIWDRHEMSRLAGTS